MRERLFNALAASLEYPTAGWRLRLRLCHELVVPIVPDAAELMEPLLQTASERSDVELEELFTRTLDHNPSRALEIGWHLFGEDYHRGALLVRLRQELRMHGITESAELPDHLTHVLKLLGRLQPEAAIDFAQACVVPAIRKLIEGLESDESGYLGLIQCIAGVIDRCCECGFEEICDGNVVPVS